ncbi:hypothetical protein GLOIN_2v1878633 [Rhizophagus irregularis DAOM 181602=DAOM 197198]|nr:hypothetical protein GLOIN_2v1878633 [Rhizophagus irregularis DAOM 181602=DAOM 197198]
MSRVVTQCLTPNVTHNSEPKSIMDRTWNLMRSLSEVAKYSIGGNGIDAIRQFLLEPIRSKTITRSCNNMKATSSSHVLCLGFGPNVQCESALESYFNLYTSDGISCLTSKDPLNIRFSDSVLKEVFGSKEVV